MNTKRILDKIEHKLQDASYAREELLEDLNDLILYVSAILPLPTLQTSGIVTIVGGTNSVDMPADYHCNVYRVENNVTDRVCKVVYNYKVLAEMHDGFTEAGSIVDVACENGVLHCRKTPATNEALTLFYNEKPTVLTDVVTSTPDCIPSHLHDPILSSYILYDKFSEIEDGIESARVNTSFYWNRFLNGMQSLQTFYPNISLQSIYQRFAKGGVAYVQNDAYKERANADG